MNRLLLVLALGTAVAVSSPVWADNDSPDAAVSTPVAPKWSLEVLRPRVAAGGQGSDEHHSEFVIRALDEKGQPLAGLAVELPQLWDYKGELGASDLENPGKAMPRVEWPSAGKTVLTDANGEAHGRFTSGARLGPVVLHGPGDSKATIEQIGNDDPNPYEGDPAYFQHGVGDIQPYKLRLRQGDDLVPIRGHHVKMKVFTVTLEARYTTGNVTEDGTPVGEPGSFDIHIKSPTEDSAPAERALWDKIISWIDTSGMEEVEPGSFQGYYKVSRPTDLYINGAKIERFSRFNVGADDSDVIWGK